MPETKSARNICFTVNNWTEEEYEDITRLAYSYLVLGKEVGLSGTPHLQGYIEFKRSMRWETIKNKIPRAHLESRKGTAKQASDYCKKDGDFAEFGEISHQGERTDLTELARMVREGLTTVDELVESNPMAVHQYGRTLSRAEDIALRSKFRNWKTEGLWLFGPTGTGKSHRAFEGFHPSTHYVWKDDNGWQDGYSGQEIVIINEFRGGIKYAQLLDLVDRWPTTLNRRAREPVPFLAKKLIITSSLPPEEVYKTLHAQDSLAQLYRRFEVYRVINQLEMVEHVPRVAEVAGGNTNPRHEETFGNLSSELRSALRL